MKVHYLLQACSSAKEKSFGVPARLFWLVVLASVHFCKFPNFKAQLEFKLQSVSFAPRG